MRKHFRPSASRGRWTLTLATSLLLLAGLMVASPAQADYQVRKTNDYIQGYGSRGKVMFYSPHICVRWKLQGVINYRATYIEEHRTTSQPGTTVYGYAVDNVKMTYNSVIINTFRADGSTCTKERKKYSKLEITEKMRGYGCDFNPSISIGAPCCGYRMATASRPANDSAPS